MDSETLLKTLFVNYDLGDHGSIFGRGGNFSQRLHVQNSFGLMKPGIKQVSGPFSRGVKRPKNELGHIPQSSAKVENARSYTSNHPKSLHGALFRYTHKFTLSSPYRLHTPFIREKEKLKIGRKQKKQQFTNEQKKPKHHL